MEIVIILATLLGGGAALWFFWDKVRDFFRGQPKEEQKSSRPSAESILCLVGDSSPTDWNYYDPDAKYYFKTDVELTIDRHPVERKSQFPETWAHNFPDRSAYAVKFTVYYGATPIKDLWAVEIDGGRSYIPYPKSAKVHTIDRWQHAFGKIINIANGTYDFDNYLQRAGITIVDS